MSVNEELVRLVKENPGLPIVPLGFIRLSRIFISFT